MHSKYLLNKESDIKSNRVIKATVLLLWTSHRLCTLNAVMAVKTSKSRSLAALLAVSFSDRLCVGDGLDDNIALKGNV